MTWHLGGHGPLPPPALPKYAIEFWNACIVITIILGPMPINNN